MLSMKSSWKNWQLLTDKGRHIWSFKSDSKDIDQHLKNANNITDEEIGQLALDFQFNKTNNPNSGDQVYRHAAVNEKFKAFSGIIPQAEHQGDQNITDALVKAMNYYSCLQSDDGHWPGDYGGPLFLLPGLLIASYISDTPFPKAHSEMMKLYLFNGKWEKVKEGQ